MLAVCKSGQPSLHPSQTDWRVVLCGATWTGCPASQPMAAAGRQALAASQASSIGPSRQPLFAYDRYMYMYSYLLVGTWTCTRVPTYSVQLYSCTTSDLVRVQLHVLRGTVLVRTGTRILQTAVLLRVGDYSCRAYSCRILVHANTAL